MEHREEGKKPGGWACVGIAIGAGLLISTIIASVWSLTPFGKPVPNVQIVQPEDSISVESGDGILVWASGESHNGFEEFFLMVDDQVIEGQQASDPRQRNPVISFTWFSSQPGIHKISVIGINNSERASQPDNILVVVNPRSVFYGPQDTAEDETLEGDENAQEEATPGDEAIDQGDPENSGDAGEEAAPDPSIPEADPEVNSENAVDQAVIDQILEDVDEDGDFPVDIPNQPDDEIPLISLFNIQESSDGGGLNVNYRIRATDDIGLAILHLEIRSMDHQWQPQHEEFACLGETICNQDGNVQLSHGGWLLSAQVLDTSGQTSEIHTAQIHSLEGNDPPAIALGEVGGNFEFVPQDEEAEVIELIDEVYDIGQPSISSYGCSGQIVYLEVPYVFFAEDANNVYLGATAEKDNIVVAAGHAEIQPGIGIAYIEMEAIAPDLIDQTDELELYFRTGGDYFYEEKAELQVNWPIPEPDLMITYVSQEESFLQAQIKNTGCLSVQGFDLRFQIADGQILDTYIDHYLAPGITYWLENFIVNANLFSMGFEVIVDPNNLITEINEDNNNYSLGPISVKHVHIKKVDIITVPENSGRGNKGEFQFYAQFNRSEIFWRPADGDGYYELGAGPFELDTIVIDLFSGQVYTDPFVIAYPVNWDEDLRFLFSAWEEDGLLLSDTEHFPVEKDLSSDMMDENSWKRGGEFSATATIGGIDYYTVYFDVVLNER